MVRRWWLIALGVVGGFVLAFPSASSAVSPLAQIELTPSGPVPATMALVAGFSGVAWQNSDTVTHTVTLADGLCAIQVPPGATRGCPVAWDVGRYAYSVDGSTQGNITITPASRSLTLTARQHTVRRGAHLRLHGLLRYQTDWVEPPIGAIFTFMPVVVLARHGRHQPFQQIANAATGSLTGFAEHDGWPWWLDLHPETTTTYIAEVNYQPDSGQIWRDAMTKPFTVVVHARR